MREEREVVAQLLVDGSCSKNECVLLVGWCDNYLASYLLYYPWGW